MTEEKKLKIAKIAIPVLSSILTILLIIPGPQGESVLSQVIEMLKIFVAGSGG